MKAKVRNALQGVMQKILQWIKDKFTPQRNQKPGEPAKPGLCPLPKPPVSKNKLPKQAKPKKPAKKGGGCGRSAMVPAGNCFPSDALAQLPDGFRRLDELAAGNRLTTYNHAERDQFEETAETRIDPATWRLVTVRQDQGDAGTIEADLLRPLGFFGGQWPNPGDEFDLDLPKLGLSGPVQVTAIAACPTIPPGPGRIVLSVFRHSRGSTGALYLVGHTEPIRVTALHPVWSPSHNAWIPAGKLTPAHDVSLWKSTCRVERYELDTREEPVYNVEVDGDHCYRVGGWGILVHNTSGPCCSGLSNTGDKTTVTTVTVGSRNVPIYGEGQKTGKIDCPNKVNAHRQTSVNIAVAAANTGDYEYFTLNRSWGTATGGVSIDEKRPDVIGVRCDGTVDAWEVISATDDATTLQMRVDDGLATLPKSSRGNTDVVPFNC